MAPTRAVAAEGGAVQREVSSFQHADGRTSLLKHITGGGALMQDTDLKAGALSAVKMPELWPLLISIGAACLLCAYKVGRMATVHPDTYWNKEQRMATIQDPDRLARDAKAYAAHKAGKEVVDSVNNIPKIKMLGMQPPRRGRDPRHQ